MPLRFRWLRPIVFVGFSVFRYFIVLIFLWPRIDYILAILSLGIIFFSVLLFVCLMIIDPGYLPRSDTLMELYDEFKPEFVCPYCRCLKDRDSRHCHQCKRCVQVI